MWGLGGFRHVHCSQVHHKRVFLRAFKGWDGKEVFGFSTFKGTVGTTLIHLLAESWKRSLMPISYLSVKYMTRASR